MKHTARPSRDKPAEPVEGERQQAELTAMLEDMYGGSSTDTPISQPTDAVLTDSVQQAQDAEPTVDAGQIRSTVEHGWATLDGEVDSAAEQQQAGRAALEVPGIRGVNNRVRLSGR
jgi:osmotically-inducible protein OsmY